MKTYENHSIRPILQILSCLQGCCFGGGIGGALRLLLLARWSSVVRCCWKQIGIPISDGLIVQSNKKSYCERSDWMFNPTKNLMERSDWMLYLIKIVYLKVSWFPESSGGYPQVIQSFDKSLGLKPMVWGSKKCKETSISNLKILRVVMSRVYRLDSFQFIFFQVKPNYYT